MCFAFFVLVPKGMLTPGLLVLLLIVLGLGTFGLVEAILATPTVPEPPAPAPAPWAAPSAPVFQQWQPTPVFQPWGQTGKQASAPRSRLYIPTPVEMLDEKNKRV